MAMANNGSTLLWVWRPSIAVGNTRSPLQELPGAIISIDDALDETDVSGLGCGIAQRLHKLALRFDPHSHQAILLGRESFHNLGEARGRDESE